jgi:hypothetical protein
MKKPSTPTMPPLSMIRSATPSRKMARGRR